MLTKKHKFLPFFMWLFPLLFFAYQFVLRLWPGLMMHQIMEQLSIDASHFGILAAFYYYGYAGMQIPTAILLDRFGPRYMIFMFAVICGLAAIIFNYTNDFYLAILSRFLIGAGSAVGFLGVSKVVSEWFPKEHYSKIIGFSFTIGLMGAIYGGKPISLLIEKHSWQKVSLILAVVSMIIGCSTYLALRSPKNISSRTQKDRQFKMVNFTTLLSSKIIWMLAFSNLLMVGSLEGFADVWGVQYLMVAHNLKKGDAAELISFLFFGMLFGGPLLATCSKKFGNYPTIATCGFGMALAFVLLLLNPAYNYLMLSCLFFCIGIMCCYQVIIFAAGSDLVASQNLGITIAFLNCINMLGGSFFHTTIGKMMDLLWSGTIGSNNLKQYDLEAYKSALSIIPVCAVIGAIIVCLIARKIKHHRIRS